MIIDLLCALFATEIGTFRQRKTRAGSDRTVVTLIGRSFFTRCPVWGGRCICPSFTQCLFLRAACGTELWRPHPPEWLLTPQVYRSFLPSSIANLRPGLQKRYVACCTYFQSKAKSTSLPNILDTSHRYCINSTQSLSGGGIVVVV